MSNKIALEVKDVSKSFRLPTEQANGIKQAFVNWTKGIHGYREQQVLKNISFTVEEGDFFGIVGRNGSGKSTLLKLISQIYVPDSGSITVNGKLVPFIELGVGFNPELTGRENVYLNGALLGFSHEEVNNMYDDVVNFAELKEFMDQKLKNYSSGMQVRLAFSIAIRAEGAILVLDEVLAVGDEAFQRKCFDYFALLKKKKKTVILVTHSMDHVQQFCNKAALIDKGHKLEIGSPSEIAQIYRELNSEVSNISDGERDSRDQPIDISASYQYFDKELHFDITARAKERVTNSIISLFIDRDTGEQVYRLSSDESTGRVLNMEPGKKVTIKLKLQNIFPEGVFTLRASVKSADRTKEYALYGNLATFRIVRIRKKSQWDIHWQPGEDFEIQYEK